MTHHTSPVPPQVQRLVDAINNADTDAFVDSFTPDGFVNDWGRELRGPAGVREWAGSDAIGREARMTILEASSDGDVVTTQFSWKSTKFNGESTGIFVIEGDLLASFTIPPHH